MSIGTQDLLHFVALPLGTFDRKMAARKNKHLITVSYGKIGSVNNLIWN